jgi:hypothetical protein
MKVIMSAARCIKGGEDEGSGCLVASSASSIRIDEGSDLSRTLYRRR